MEKTTIARKLVKSETLLSDFSFGEQNLQFLKLQPSKILDYESPILIDEWQVIPRLWDVVRSKVDEIRNKIKFILIGSTTLNTKAIKHTGTGRILKLMMRPMSSFEANDSDGGIELSRLLNDEKFDNSDITMKSKETKIKSIAFLSCRGGWPKAVALNNDAAIRHVKNYCEDLIINGVKEVDGSIKKNEILRNILQSISRNIGTKTSIEKILEDVNEKRKAKTITRKPLEKYIEAFWKLFVFEEIEAWSPQLRSKTRIMNKPKKYMIDPSIAANFLFATPSNLLNDLRTFGFIFENYCARDLQIYCQNIDAKLFL